MNTRTRNKTKGSDAPQASTKEVEEEKEVVEEQMVEEAVEQVTEESNQETPAPEVEGEQDVEMEKPEQEEVAADNTQTQVPAEMEAEECDAAVVKDEQEEEEEEKPKFHTNGAQRKRFRWFLEQGYERAEASELARDAAKYRELRAEVEGRNVEMTETEKMLAEQRKSLTRNAKRKLNQLLDHGFSAEEAVALAPKLAEVKYRSTDEADTGYKHPKLHPASAEASGSGPVVLFVIPSEFPQTTLTEDQAKQVKAALLKQVVEQKETMTRPQFGGCTYANGYLMFECRNQPTVTWLQFRTRELKILEGVTLKAVSEKIMRRCDIFTARFPDAEQDSDEEISNFIKKQNPQIDMEKWKILERKALPNQVVELVIKIDPVSLKALEDQNCMLTFKFDQVRVRRKRVVIEERPPHFRGQPGPGNQRWGNRQDHFGPDRYGGANRGPGRGGGFHSRGRGNPVDSLNRQLNRTLAFPAGPGRAGNSYGNNFGNGPPPDPQSFINGLIFSELNQQRSYGRGGFNQYRGGRGRGSFNQYNRGGNFSNNYYSGNGRQFF